MRTFIVCLSVWAVEISRAKKGHERRKLTVSVRFFVCVCVRVFVRVYMREYNVRVISTNTYQLLQHRHHSSQNDQRHELVFLRPLSFKTLKP